MSATAAQVLKLKRYIWTGATAAVTVTGAIYGAGLKEQSDAKKKGVHKTYEATFEERLASLEKHRATLVSKRMGIEKKIADLEARRTGAVNVDGNAKR